MIIRMLCQHVMEAGRENEMKCTGNGTGPDTRGEGGEAALGLGLPVRVSERRKVFFPLGPYCTSIVVGIYW